MIGVFVPDVSITPTSGIAASASWISVVLWRLTTAMNLSRSAWLTKRSIWTVTGAEWVMLCAFIEAVAVNRSPSAFARTCAPGASNAATIATAAPVFKDIVCI